MEGLLSYDFTKYLLLSILIGAPIPFLKNEILKDFSVIELGLIGNFLLISLYIIVYVFYEKKGFTDLLKKKDSKKMPIFILFIILVFIGLLIGGTILKKEGSVIRYKSFQRSLSIVLMLIIGMCLFKEKITFNMCLGVGVTALGLYLIEKR